MQLLTIQEQQLCTLYAISSSNVTIHVLLYNVIKFFKDWFSLLVYTVLCYYLLKQRQIKLEIYKYITNCG